MQAEMHQRQEQAEGRDTRSRESGFSSPVSAGRRPERLYESRLFTIPSSVIP